MRGPVCADGAALVLADRDDVGEAAAAIEASGGQALAVGVDVGDADSSQGDEILVSGLLKALTESAGEFTFGAGREVELKGISGPQRMHAVEWR